MKEPASSNFYFHYPSKAVPHSRSHKGEFEVLQQNIAAGFNAKSNVASSVDKPLCDEGILILDMNDCTQIKESMKKVPNRLRKFQTNLAYLMEFGCDLAIDPSRNVSLNPGFESIIGLFNQSM